VGDIRSAPCLLLALGWLLSATGCLPAFAQPVGAPGPIPRNGPIQEANGHPLMWYLWHIERFGQDIGGDLDDRRAWDGDNPEGLVADERVALGLRMFGAQKKRGHISAFCI